MLVSRVYTELLFTINLTPIIPILFFVQLMRICFLWTCVIVLHLWYKATQRISLIDTGNGPNTPSVSFVFFCCD